MQHPTALTEDISTISCYHSSTTASENRKLYSHGSFDYQHKMSYHGTKDSGPLAGSVSLSPLARSVSYTRPLARNVSYARPLAESVSYSSPLAGNMSYSNTWVGSSSSQANNSTLPRVTSNSSSAKEELESTSIIKSPVISEVESSSYWTLWMKDFSQAYKVSIFTGCYSGDNGAYSLLITL